MGVGHLLSALGGDWPHGGPGAAPLASLDRVQHKWSSRWERGCPNHAVKHLCEYRCAVFLAVIGSV